jgi:hypothetical protein
LSCQRCEPRIYHQDCVEKYLKKHGFPKARLSGFPCPYGKGKATDNPCKGKIDTSHAILPKNDEKKKAHMVMPAVVEALQQARPAKAPKNTPKAPAAKPPAPAAKGPVAKPHAGKPPIINRAVPPQPLGLNRMAGNAADAGVPPNAWAQRGAAPVIAGAHTHPDTLPDQLAAQHPAAGDTPAQLPVGMVFDEAAVSEALPKALRKNLARREKKRQQAAMQDAASEASADVNDPGAAEQYDESAWGAFAAPTAGAVGAESGYMGSGSGFELIGYDGTAIHVHDDNPVQPGQRFLDAAGFAQLFGGALSDGDDDEDDANHYQAEAQQPPAGDTEQQGALGDQAESWRSYPLTTPSFAACYGAAGAPVTPAPVPAPVPVAVPVVAPVAVPVAAPVAGYGMAAYPPAAPVVEGKDPVSEQAAFDAAIQASIAQFYVEEEMRKQRAALVNGFNRLGANTVNLPALSRFHRTPGVQGAPVAVPVVAPVAVPVPSPSVVFNHTKQQPEAPAGYGNQGWVFGGVNQGAGALPPHFPAGYTQFEASAVPMAAGHSAPEVADSDDDDDGLSTLLALCGVAG